MDLKIPSSSWDCHILNHVVESQILTFSEIDTTNRFLTSSSICQSDKRILQLITPELTLISLLERESWFVNGATREHEKTAIFTSLVYG
jgi:hypothetical protein